MLDGNETYLIQLEKVIPGFDVEKSCGENGFNIFKGILMTYLKKGGQSIQFNIFNTETLREAQENTDKYKNLQVRVCGWNTLWNNMSKKEQDAYILRAENIQ